MKMRELGATRLSVCRTPRHICAGYFCRWRHDRSAGEHLDADLRSGNAGNVETAAKVGTLIAERAKAQGISTVAFDRSGFKYHGRVEGISRRGP